MDWKRAKTILIIMFLVINMFLFYQLFASGRDQYKYTNAQELTSIKEYMTGKNVKFDTEIPDRVQVIPSLRVGYYNFELERVKKMFFAGKKPELLKLAEGYELTSGDISVEVKNGIYLTYKNQAIKIKQSQVKKEKCLSHIDKFIEDLKLDTGNRYVKVNEVKNGSMRIVLGQQYKKLPVENSELEVIATEEGVAEARINWFEWIKSDSKLNITTPIVALLKAFESRKEDAAPTNVKQIRQGYYFNIDRQKDPQESVAIEGTAFPVWVIVTDKNQIYINAYSEEFEKIQ